MSSKKKIQDPLGVMDVISQPHTTCVDVILNNNRVICSNRPDWAEDERFPNLREKEALEEKQRHRSGPYPKS